MLIPLRLSASMLRRLTLILFMFFPAIARAQSVQGSITDNDDAHPLAAVSVTNLRSHQVTTSDATGKYYIAAREGDQLSFSFIGYKTIRRSAPSSIIITTMNVQMQRQAQQLDELTVRPHKLTQYQEDSAERRAVYKKVLTRRHPSPINSPISAIAELFNKKARRDYKFQKVYRDNEPDLFIDTRYTPEVVADMTGLTGDSLGHFMNAYPMPYEFARAASDIEVKMWIRTNYRQWKKTLSADPARDSTLINATTARQNQ